MGWLKKKSESFTFADLLAQPDDVINKALKGAKMPQKSAKDLRKAAKTDRRKLEGEKGMGALLAGMKGGGTGNQNYDKIPDKEKKFQTGGGTGNKNFKNIPKVERQHPSITRRERAELAQEVQQARARGDRAAEVRLKQQAKRDGLI